MRKTISLVLAVLMMLVLLPAVKLSTASAEETTSTYEKVESADAITDGSYLIVVDSKKIDGAYYTFNGTSSGSFNKVNVDITDGVITGDYSANEIEITEVEGGYTLENSEGKYLGAGNGSNTVVFGDDAVVNGIALGGDLKVSINMTTDVARELKLNNSNDQPFFRYYKVSTTGSNYYLPSLYKKVEGTEPDPSPSTEPDPSPEPETTAMELVTELTDGAEVVIYNAPNSKAMTGENEYFEHATNPAKNKWQIVAVDATLTDGVLAVPEEAVRLTVEKNPAEGEKPATYAFKSEDGNYLYADGTDTMFVERSDDNAANTLFQLEPVEGGFYIKCDSATYNDKAQYIEYYGGHYTCYGMGSNAAIYTFQFYAEPNEEPPIEPTGDTIILFTNDVHCGIRDGWGYAGVADLKKTLEAEGNEVILVDAGDHSQGDSIGSLTKGEYIIDIMNAVGYDLAIPGNHEFDYGMTQFLDVLAVRANYPYVSANFMDLNTNKTVFDPYKIIEANGKKIAFVGLSTPESITKSTPAYFMNEDHTAYIYGFCQDTTGAGVYTAAQNAIDAAKAEGADYVILVGHMGIDTQSQPWTAPEVIANTTGVNAFIDGHSHSVINTTVKDKDDKDVLHGQTGTKLANVGKLTIKADGTMTMELLPASEKVKDDPEVDAYIKTIEDEFAELLNTVVAYTDHVLTIKDPDTGNRAVRSAETNLGDLCADAYRYMFDADIAFVNGGGVRENIPAGDITFGQIIKVHPFGNTAVLAEVTGQQILDALEMGARVCPDENGGFLQVSGLTYEIHTYLDPNVVIDDAKVWQSSAGLDEYRVKNVKVFNKTTGEYELLDLAKKYTLASHNYMLMQMGDGFAMFNNITILEDSGKLDNQVLIDYIQSMPVEDGKHVVEGYTDPRGEGRITIVPEMPVPGVTFYGEDKLAADVEIEENGETLYRYDIKVNGIDPDIKVVGLQLFVEPDSEALEFVEATTTLEGTSNINLDNDGLISFAWAAEGDGMTIEDDTVIISLFFKLTAPVEDGAKIQIAFAEGANGAMTGFSYASGETVIEAENVKTEDGSITFKLPDGIVVYGENVESIDIRTIEDEKVAYKYDIKIKGLPEAGLKINSMQIFTTFDNTLLQIAKITSELEGFVDSFDQEKGTLFVVWASDSEVAVKNGDTLFSIYFIAPDAKGGDVAEIGFTKNSLGNNSAVSYVFGGKVVELETETENGSITFSNIVLGDANCDGKVTSADAAAVLRSIVGLNELSPLGALNADVDGDGEVTQEDAVLILRWIVNLIEKFPIEP